MASWQLQDPAEQRQNAKYTFAFPSQMELDKVAAGVTVKLIFQLKNPGENVPEAERMWVDVVSRNEDGTLTGTLDNDPRCIDDLKHKDVVTFELKHIIATNLPVQPDDDCMVEKYFSRCFVTRRVLYDEQKVTSLYREEPDQPNDSGWRILAGDETEDYMEDTENVFYVSLGAVLNCDDRFVHLLDQPVGSCFEFDDASGKFVISKSD